MSIPRKQAADWLRKAGKSEAQIREQLAGPATEQKYHNKPSDSIDGKRKDSTAEARWYSRLVIMERAGMISNLTPQVTVVLLRYRNAKGTGWSRISMRVDATYEQDGETIYAEYKGFICRDWHVKKRLWGHCGPGVYRITYGSGKTEDVRPRPCAERLVTLLRDMLRDDAKVQAALKALDAEELLPKEQP